jgi:hypothetical protein
MKSSSCSPVPQTPETTMKARMSIPSNPLAENFCLPQLDTGIKFPTPRRQSRFFFVAGVAKYHYE